MCRLLLGLQCGQLALVLCQSSANGTGLLGAEIEGEVFLVLVEEA